MDVAPWDKHWIKIELDGIGVIRWCLMVFVGIRGDLQGFVGICKDSWGFIEIRRESQEFVVICWDSLVLDGV